MNCTRRLFQRANSVRRVFTLDPLEHRNAVSSLIDLAAVVSLGRMSAEVSSGVNAASPKKLSPQAGKVVAPSIAANRSRDSVVMEEPGYGAVKANHLAAVAVTDFHLKHGEPNDQPDWLSLYTGDGLLVPQTSASQSALPNATSTGSALGIPVVGVADRSQGSDSSNQASGSMTPATQTHNVNAASATKDAFVAAAPAPGTSLGGVTGQPVGPVPSNIASGPMSPTIQDRKHGFPTGSGDSSYTASPSLASRAPITALRLQSNDVSKTAAPMVAGANDPIIEYNHSGGGQSDTSFTDLIGGYGGIYVEPPPGSGLMIQNVKWSASGAYLQQNFNYRTGFVNVPLDTTQFTGDSLQLFWDENGGSRTVTADVTYVGGLSGSATLTGTVVKPTGTITAVLPSAADTPGVTSESQPYLRTNKNYNGQIGHSGIVFTVSVDPTSTAGLDTTYGMIQTIPSYLSNRTYYSFGSSTVHTDESSVAKPAGGQLSRPRPLVDDDGSSWLYGPEAVLDHTKSQADNSFLADDSPGTPLVSGYESYSFVATFKDTLMIHKGIWVPLGNLTWDVSMGANKSSTAASGWGVSYTPTTAGPYAASSAFPDWVESNNYLKNTYGWVQVS